MAYTPTTWVANTTKLGPTNLNHLELGVQATAVVADAALPTPAGSDGQFLQRVSGVWVPHTLVAADMPSGIALSKFADPGAGNVVTSAGAGAVAAKPPGYEFDYAQITSGVTVAGTSSGSPTTVVSGAAVTYDGATVVKAIFQAEDITIATGHTVDIGLYEDGALKATLAEAINNAGANMRLPGVHGEFRFTPAAGSHTYSVRAWTSAATLDSVDASATAPAFLQVVKVK